MGLQLQALGRKPSPHRASENEGEAAAKLLEQHGYILRRQSTQYVGYCPFHEEPGDIKLKRSPNFYLNRETSQYYCFSASCGEKGNLVTLERFFDVDPADTSSPIYGRQQQLLAWEEDLTPDRFGPFTDHGLTETTIRRFRLGYDAPSGRYVIPYLEGRRPMVFRFYSPEHKGPNGSKYWWESGAEARLFNASDAVGGQDNTVILTEGEQKAMLLCQLGYAAVAVPGASTFKREWHEHFSQAKQIIVCFDNDNPAFHVYENCAHCGKGQCRGHNPGQEAASRVIRVLGWRAKNVLLPRADDQPKTDINEFFVRDGYSNADFAHLALGKRKTPYKMASLAEVKNDPPDESQFIVSDGILPEGGRLLVTGAPKSGKSLWVQNLALSIASGIPFLRRFAVDEPRRVGLLDRELSRSALYHRLGMLQDDRPGYLAADANLLIDHDVRIYLDRPDEAYDKLYQLVEENGLDVLIFDTAYKFFASSFTKEDSVSKGFGTLDRLIADTGVSVVLTHHHRKRNNDWRSQKAQGPGEADDVVGSFLWTGWPNGTVLLNFLNRSVDSPFNAICSFVAFRDAPPPDPIVLYRDRDSIAYRAIQDYRPDEPTFSLQHTKLNAQSLGDLLIKLVPIASEDFVQHAAGEFGCKRQTVELYLLDLLSRGDFLKSDSHPPILRYAHEVQEETYEQEQLRF